MTTTWTRTSEPQPRPDCILWGGRIRDDGYPTLGVRMAHRVAWERERGPIPRGLVLDHVVCRVRRCVNVGHLEPVTVKVNRERQELHRVLVTRCPSGHEGEYVEGSNGKRYCRRCKRERSRRDRRKAKG